MTSMALEFQVLCLVALLPLRSLGFICPGAIYPPEGLSYAHIEPNFTARASQEYAKIRIQLIHDQSIEGKSYKELVQKAADFWSNVISVKPVSGRLFMAPPCNTSEGIVYRASEESSVKQKYCLGSCSTAAKCHHFVIPKEHLDGCMSCKRKGENCSKNDAAKGTGVGNADIVFYVTATDTKDCTKDVTVAYAGPCQLDPILDRPIFAIINICPDVAAKHNFESLLKTIKHEMMHAFGFGFFHLFRDSDGNPLWSRDENGQRIEGNDVEGQRVLKTFERDWHVRGLLIKTNRTFLITPKVVNEVRTHFACPDLEGAELEDFGENGTQNVHFEARVFYDDAMKGNVNTGKGLFSRLDFAVLEDTGWYKVDYSQAQDMEFGKSLGCDFSMKSCKFWINKKRKEGKSVEPYCNTPDFLQERGFFCRGTKRLFSGCPLVECSLESIRRLHDQNSLVNPFANVFELPQKYQYFDKIPGVSSEDVGKFDGAEELTDFCPIPFKNLEVPDTNFECSKKTANDSSGKEPLDSEKDPNVDEKDEINQSIHLCSSGQLVSLLACILVLLLRGHL